MTKVEIKSKHVDVDLNNEDDASSAIKKTFVIVADTLLKHYGKPNKNKTCDVLLLASLSDYSHFDIENGDNEDDVKIDFGEGSESHSYVFGDSISQENGFVPANKLSDFAYAFGARLVHSTGFLNNVKNDNISEADWGSIGLVFKMVEESMLRGAIEMVKNAVPKGENSKKQATKFEKMVREALDKDVNPVGSLGQVHDYEGFIESQKLKLSKSCDYLDDTLYELRTNKSQKKQARILAGLAKKVKLDITPTLGKIVLLETLRQCAAEKVISEMNSIDVDMSEFTNLRAVANSKELDLSIDVYKSAKSLEDVDKYDDIDDVEKALESIIDAIDKAQPTSETLKRFLREMLSDDEDDDNDDDEVNNHDGCR